MQNHVAWAILGTHTKTVPWLDSFFCIHTGDGFGNPAPVEYGKYMYCKHAVNISLFTEFISTGAGFLHHQLFVMMCK